MADSTLDSLTAATAATGGLFYGTQAAADRKFTLTAAGATLTEAADAAAQRTALGAFASAGGALTGLLSFSGTTHAGIRLNSLTTVQRDALTAGAGDFLFNSTLSQFQGYTGAAWQSMAGLTSNTFTGQQIITANGAASTPPLLLNGTIFTGGTGATNLPNLLIQPTGATAAAGWSPSGTAFGINLDVAAGNFAHFMVDGSSKLTIDTTGTVTLPGTGNFLALGGGLRGGNIYINTTSNILEMYNDACFLRFGAGVSTADLSRGGAYCLQLGTDAAPVSNQHFKSCDRITSDGAGANLTISGGNGRGGAGGDLILASYTTAGSGVAGTLTTRWQLDAATGALLPGATATYNLGSAAAVLANIYSTDYYSGSTKVVGARQTGFAAVTGSPGAGIDTIDLSGLTTIISNMQTAINTCRDALNAHGLTTTV